MEKIKLMTIVGTRPEIIRLSAVIKKCDRYFNQLLVHTGQNYDYTLNQIFFEDLELRAPDFYLKPFPKNSATSPSPPAIRKKSPRSAPFPPTPTPPSATSLPRAMR